MSDKFSMHWAAACGIVMLAMLALLSSPDMMLRDPDTAWHVFAGDWIRAHGAVPLTDPWSLTAKDLTWVNLAWGWDVWMSVLHQHFGWQGQMVFTGLCVGITMAMLYGICLMRAGNGLAAFLAVFLVFISNTPLVRSLWVSNIFLVTLYGLALMIQHRGWNIKWWYVMPLLMPLWVNLHGAFIVAFFLLGAYGLQALLARNWLHVFHLSLAGLLSIVAMAISPFGFTGVTQVVINTLTTPALKFLAEFQPTALPWGFFFTFPFVPMFLFFALRRPMLLPMSEKILIFTMLVLGGTAIRYWNFFFIFAAPVLAMYFALSMRGDQKNKANPTAAMIAQFFNHYAFIKHPRASIIATTLLAAAIIAWLFSPAAGKHFALDRLAPYDGFKLGLAFIEKNYPNHRFFNEYSTGGPLIYVSKGTFPVFIDGRGENTYPRDVINAYDKMLGGDTGWDMFLEDYHINGIIAAAYENSRLELRFAKRKGWKKVFSDETLNIYIKE